MEYFVEPIEPDPKADLLAKYKLTNKAWKAWAAAKAKAAPALDTFDEPPVPPPGYDEYKQRLRVYNRRKALAGLAAKCGGRTACFRGDEIDDTWTWQDLFGLCQYLVSELAGIRSRDLELDVELKECAGRTARRERV